MRFPSQAWLEAAVAAANQHPELARAVEGLGRDVAVVVEPEPPAFTGTFAAYGRHERGRLTAVRFLADPDEIWELEPTYVFRATYGVWKALVQGADPLQAAMSGRVRVSGDMAALVRRSSYRYVMQEVLTGLVTEFADEHP